MLRKDAPQRCSSPGMLVATSEWHPPPWHPGHSRRWPFGFHLSEGIFLIFQFNISIFYIFCKMNFVEEMVGFHLACLFVG